MHHINEIKNGYCTLFSPGYAILGIDKGSQMLRPKLSTNFIKSFSQIVQALHNTELGIFGSLRNDVLNNQSVDGRATGFEAMLPIHWGEGGILELRPGNPLIQRVAQANEPGVFSSCTTWFW